MVFPDIQVPDYPLEELHKDHTIKMTVDNETVLTRPRFTKIPKSFKITWSKLPTKDFNKLRAFYSQTRGDALSFEWTYPKDEGNDYAGKKFIVRFDDGLLDFKIVECSFWSGSITLSEV